MKCSNASSVASCRLTLRALLIAVGLTVLGNLWIDRAELVAHVFQGSEAVPPVPAVAFLLLLVALNPLLTRLWRRLALSRAEILFIYCFLAIAITMAGPGIVKYLFPATTALFYFATPENRYEQFQPYLPAWFAPRNLEVLRAMYEGAEEGGVPWGAWKGPLLLWTAFFGVLWLTLLSLTVLLQRQWTERERLTFPLLYLPLEVTGEGDGTWLGAAFFKNPLMWLGFGLSSLYNLLNILHAFNPSVITLGRTFNLGALFTERPLNAIQPLYFWYRPELIGFGYLVSLDVLLSTWVCYFLLKAESVGAVLLGYDLAGFPFPLEQGTGAYVALALFLLWIARHHWRDVIRRTFNFQRTASPQEVRRYRLALLGFGGGLAVLYFWLWAAGMAWWVLLIYWALIFAFALVYIRIRAETGVPNIWLFPYWQQEKAILNAFGSTPLAPGGDYTTLTVMSAVAFLPRGYFPSAAAYQLESLKLAEETRLRRSSMVWVIVLALLVGLAAAYWTNLTSYYQYGINVLDGGSIQGGYRCTLARNEYDQLASYAQMPKPPDRLRTGFSLVGFLFTALLLVLRTVFLRFPLHPLGFALATTYGDRLWGPFLLVWGLKLGVFKLGGANLYKRLIPAFLGLALGHFFLGGVVWGNLAMYAGDAGFRYGVHFG
ncbi:MAG TPA: hypothetical protein EYP85_00265 [Armatimonadetes bacterium]|nr:hypothetical protein [Armatimonadota bacterium]